MKFFWLPILFTGITIPQHNFIVLPAFAHSFFAADIACHSTRSKHHRKYRRHRAVTSQDNPFAPQFDPHSPELAQQLMAVFGQDTLVYRAQQSYKKHHPKRKFGVNKSSSKPKKATKPQADWLESILSDLSKQLPFQSDINLGSNSNSDVYLEVNAEKNWQINPDFDFNAQQTFRYGAQSRNYSETNFNFTQKQAHEAIASNQLSITKTYDDTTYNWENYLFRKQKINHDQSITYGLYSNGVYNKDKRDVEVQSWGPYFSWRRPLWRDWLYLENGVSYYQDRTDENRHVFSTTVQFDMAF